MFPFFQLHILVRVDVSNFLQITNSDQKVNLKSDVWVFFLHFVVSKELRNGSGNSEPWQDEEEEPRGMEQVGEKVKS